MGLRTGRERGQMFASLPFPELSPALLTIPGFSVGDMALGPFSIRWYALAYIGGLVLGWRYAVELVKRPRLFSGKPTATVEQVDDAIFWVTLGVILGGRIGYVLFYQLPFQTETVLSDPLTIFKVWEGGMSFHGGLIGVALAMIWMAYSRGIPLLRLCDIAAAVTPIGLMLGRLANFINAELFGRHTDWRFGMVFPEGYGPGGSPEAYDWVRGEWIYTGAEMPRHASQLYQATLEGGVLLIGLAYCHLRIRRAETTGPGDRPFSHRLWSGAVVRRAIPDAGHVCVGLAGLDHDGNALVGSDVDHRAGPGLVRVFAFAEDDRCTACRLRQAMSDRQPESLLERLVARIRNDGPLSLAAYMTACLHDRRAGYYATRPGLGKDFTTAPETSQIFGELLGVWAVAEWQAIGRPDPFALVEMGPGRGVLMQDALRAAASVSPDFISAMRLTLIEPAPALQGIQANSLARYAPVFVTGLEKLGPGPMILMANEVLDCLPMRRFGRNRDTGAWHEYRVGLDVDGALAFGLDRSPASVTSGFAGGDAPGETLELQPGLDTLVTMLADRQTQKYPFRALFIDYGPGDRAPEDSLRAYKDGRQTDPLADPGTSDLTVDVDFARLASLVSDAGLGCAGPLEQGRFLLALGAETRTRALMRDHPHREDTIYEGARKLLDPDEMGARFKVLAISSDRLPDPAGFGS